MNLLVSYAFALFLFYPLVMLVQQVLGVGLSVSGLACQSFWNCRFVYILFVIFCTCFDLTSVSELLAPCVLSLILQTQIIHSIQLTITNDLSNGTVTRWDFSDSFASLPSNFCI